MNLIIRVRARLENKEASEIRLEISKRTGMSITFMQSHDDAQKVLED